MSAGESSVWSSCCSGYQSKRRATRVASGNLREEENDVPNLDFVPPGSGGGLTFICSSSECLRLESCIPGQCSVEQAKQVAHTQPIYSPDEPPPPLNGIALPKSYGRDTGDLDVMVKRRNIRALLILSPISFFYDNGHPEA